MSDGLLGELLAKMVFSPSPLRTILTNTRLNDWVPAALRPLGLLQSAPVGLFVRPPKLHFQLRTSSPITMTNQAMSSPSSVMARC